MYIDTPFSPERLGDPTLVPTEKKGVSKSKSGVYIRLGDVPGRSQWLRSLPGSVVELGVPQGLYHPLYLFVWNFTSPSIHCRLDS